jgi:K+ transporter
MTDRRTDESEADSRAARQKAKVALSFASLGVVFGDIGTSPIYALREALAHAAGGGEIARGDVLGIVSLLLWALIIVVTFKYVFLLMKADNKAASCRSSPWSSERSDSGEASSCFSASLAPPSSSATP